MCRWQKRSRFYSAIITNIHTDGTYDVQYADGVGEKNVESEYIKKDSVKRSTSKKITPTMSLSTHLPSTMAQPNREKNVKVVVPGKIHCS